MTFQRPALLAAALVLTSAAHAQYTPTETSAPIGGQSANGHGSLYSPLETFSPIGGQSANGHGSLYSPLETFAPLALPDPVNAYRSASGAPGPLYWQNRADYAINATLDPAAKTLTATETITYTNHSPDTLASLWLNLEQNTYRRDARSAAFAGPGRRRTASAADNNFTDGFQLDSVELQPSTPHALPTKAHTVVTDTRLQIQLPEDHPLPHNGVLVLKIRYHYTIPGKWGGRTSWGAAQQGDIFDIAQWYPRLCVYDDLHGWDTQPYLSNEFYLEYGDFDYRITVPANFLVAASGELVNPAEVLTKAQQQRLAQARTSDKTVQIVTAEEATAAAAQHPTATKTWHFKMANTRDVVFSASPAFLWDAARINLPNHRTALAQSVYPAESNTPEGWQRSTEYLKDAVEHFSQRWLPYPYPNAINVAGFSSGMEYPGVLFDGITDKDAPLFWITAHEIGHTWFPMVVGFNERRNAWMDEGFNTFIDTFESEDYDHGRFAPKRDGEYAPDPKTPPADQLAKIMADPDAPVITMRADAIREKYRHPVTYFKSAYGLTLLREDILGPERFDHAFRKFIRDWAYKHPSPSDFFRAMQSEGGEDLSYFIRGYYLNNWQLDLAVTDATYDPATHTTKVTVANLNKLVLPATLSLTIPNAPAITLAVPAETWLQNTTHTFTIPTPTQPTAATIDPDHHLPDADRTNNTHAIP